MVIVREDKTHWEKMKMLGKIENTYNSTLEYIFMGVKIVLFPSEQKEVLWDAE